MSAASSSCQGSFDVFLNFRGEDTRNGFTAHLYEALCNNEIQTFMDADKIVKGQEISPALVTAIHNSMFCVVVLSKNYASSTWCLDELVEILKCKNDKKQTVLPIFYDVNPSDVRQQKGSFAEAFAKHEEKSKEKKGRVQIWKQALNEVANISGWDARNRHEPTLIKEIIEHISSRLINRSSKDAKAMIGVDSHLSTSESDIPKPVVAESNIESNILKPIVAKSDAESDILKPVVTESDTKFDILKPVVAAGRFAFHTTYEWIDRHTNEGDNLFRIGCILGSIAATTIMRL